MHKKSQERLIVYGSPNCGMVAPVRAELERAGVVYDYVDIRKDVEGRQQVRAINDGYESVPTLRFGDGATLTEPSLRQLRAELATRGYRPVAATPGQRIKLWLQHPALRFTSLGLGFAAALDRDPILFGIGLALFLTYLLASASDS